MPQSIEHKTLPVIKKTVTHEQIRRYAQASGDHNPVHLDAEFAVQSSFGEIVAHGMLTLAFLSEMLTQAFGRSWLESGGLKVRFKRPAYPGDQLHTWGEVTKELHEEDRRVVECSIALFNAKDQDLITGTATVNLPINQEQDK